MTVLVLDTRLFPDDDTLEAALARWPAVAPLRRLAVPADGDDRGWDQVLAAILTADAIVTT